MTKRCTWKDCKKEATHINRYNNSLACEGCATWCVKGLYQKAIPRNCKICHTTENLRVCNSRGDYCLNCILTKEVFKKIKEK